MIDGYGKGSRRWEGLWDDGKNWEGDGDGDGLVATAEMVKLEVGKKIEGGCEEGELLFDVFGLGIEGWG